MVISHADNAAVSDVGQTCIVAGAVGVGVISWYLKQMGFSFTRDAGTKCALANENTLSHPKRTKSCERYVILVCSVAMKRSPVVARCRPPLVAN